MAAMPDPSLQDGSQDPDGHNSTTDINDSEMDEVFQQNLNRTNIDKYKSLVDSNASRALLVKGLSSPQLSNELINSLFSNFGNVTKLVYLKKKSEACIEYPTKELASIARELLNGHSFYGCKMKVARPSPDHLLRG